MNELERVKAERDKVYKALDILCTTYRCADCPIKAVCPFIDDELAREE